MAHSLKQLTLAASSVLALAASTQPADARSVIGYSGSASNAAENGCFQESYGTVKNVCSGTRAYNIPLVVDQAGYHSVVVTAYGASSANNIGSQAWGVNKEGTSVWGGSLHYLPKFGVATDISLPAPYVPPSGAMYAFFWMDEGSQVNVVNYAP